MLASEIFFRKYTPFSKRREIKEIVISRGAVFLIFKKLNFLGADIYGGGGGERGGR